jgi:hypothetical protein
MQYCPNNEIQTRILEIMDFYRGVILDAVEQEIGESCQWPFLRSRLLKALGDRGLVGKVLAELDKYVESERSGS